MRLVIGIDHKIRIEQRAKLTEHWDRNIVSFSYLRLLKSYRRNFEKTSFLKPLCS